MTLSKSAFCPASPLEQPCGDGTDDGIVQGHIRECNAWQWFDRITVLTFSACSMCFVAGSGDEVILDPNTNSGYFESNCAIVEEGPNAMAPPYLRSFTNVQLNCRSIRAR